jgi:hypothetical protein
MSKKMMLLALSVVSAALFALPAIASATPAHIDKAENFTVAGGAAAVLETTTGETITCAAGVTGSGSFENTTTGTINLKFHKCTTVVFGFKVACTTSGEPSETIATTALPFHLIMIAANTPGVLITPNASGSFAHFACAGVNKTVEGNGVIGTITSPKCGVASKTATLSFAQGATTGLQQHTTYTGVNYHLESGGNKASQTATGTITFAAARTITCT